MVVERREERGERRAESGERRAERGEENLRAPRRGETEKEHKTTTKLQDGSRRIEHKIENREGLNLNKVVRTIDRFVRFVRCGTPGNFFPLSWCRKFKS